MNSRLRFIKMGLDIFKLENTNKVEFNAGVNGSGKVLRSEFIISDGVN